MSKKVVLDPGHGAETAGKRSPDGTYLEHEFNLDMAKRLKSLLEGHGVQVVLTREDEHDISNTRRAEISNQEKPDLFVSLHSNAAGDGTKWMSARGYGVYTSAADEQAGRNKCAKALLKRAQEGGVPLWGGGMHHASFTVLTKTAAPAVLIEHLFHDNEEDVALLKSEACRVKLAEVDCKGILDYLGIAWNSGLALTQRPIHTAHCPFCGLAIRLERGVSL